MFELLHITKDYYIDGKPFRALNDVNLTFENKGFVSILGPSGCGKTTLLNIVGGLDHYTDGDLLIDGRSTKTFRDKDWDFYRNRRIGFVFQTYNLIPHLSISENVQLSLTLTGVNKASRVKKTKRVLELVGLGDAMSKRPNQLSGGQMQRVAIARALVNDPDIILADEPTGALDSKTSMQVIDILNEIAKEKLVIMVTHNKEIADRYSTRIITLNDGQITSDSSHIPMITHGEKIEVAVTGKTNMSFFTALRTSAKNLLTKKGRTILTAVASSFGIIGVALVLAMQNGFTNYVDQIETQTAASLPITIQPYTTKLLSESKDDSSAEYPDDGLVHVYNPSSKSSIAHRNNFTPEYIDYVNEMKEDNLTGSILYNRNGLDFDILTKKVNSDNNIMKVQQYYAASTTSGLISSVTALPGTVFHEMYGDQAYTESMYQIVDGRYPTQSNELVLILNKYNQVYASTLYQLGIIESPDAGVDTIPFSEIYSHEYRAYNPDIYMGNPTSYDVDTYEIDTTMTIAKVILKGGENITADDLVRKNGTKTIYKYEYKDDQTYFDASNKGALNELYYDNSLSEGTDYLSLHVVGVLRVKEETYINLMPSSIGYLSSLKNYFSEKYNSSEISEHMSTNWYIPRTDEAWTNFSDAITSVINGDVTDTSKLMEDVNDSIVCENIYYGVGNPNNISTFMTQSARFGVDFPVNEKVVTGDFENMSDDEMIDLFGSINTDMMSYIVYYLGYSTITSIIIFPLSLTTKAQIIERLDNYNKERPDLEQVVYTDIVGSITDSIGVMIQVISAVLIVFASISLAVSCVMTGIIIYVSVLERTKEIGILRAIGARKKDIGRLFEAESVIIGFVAGAIGIFTSYILCIPVNIILDNMFPKDNLGQIANLHPLAALILIGISVLLTFIAGFFPSRFAAKKDPVEALRSE